MKIRHVKLKKNDSVKNSWTVLPPKFYDHLIHLSSKVAASFCVGHKTYFPPIWEVDHVFVPLFIAKERWLLVKVDMKKMMVHQYWTEDYAGEIYRHLIHPFVTKFAVYFGALLVNIRYWRKSGYSERQLEFWHEEKYIQTNHRFLIENSGVLCCMIMEHLTLEKAFDFEEDIWEAVDKFRRFMADKIYLCRIPKTSETLGPAVDV